MSESQDWVFLIEVDHDLEADIIIGFLQEHGIPSRKADSSPYTGAMRVIGGLAYEVQIYVPMSFLEQAKGYLEDLKGGYQ